MTDLPKRILRTLAEIENLAQQAKTGASGGGMFSGQDSSNAYREVGLLLQEASQQIEKLDETLEVDLSHANDMGNAPSMNASAGGDSDSLSDMGDLEEGN